MTDAACPLCGPGCKTPSNCTRKVLRIWDDGGDFITFTCARCGESGYAKEEGSGRSEPRRRTEPAKPAEPVPDKSGTARFLWERSRAAIGSPAEVYLRSRGCWVDSPNIRFLAPREGHDPAMIARFGLGVR